MFASLFLSKKNSLTSRIVGYSSTLAIPGWYTIYLVYTTTQQYIVRFQNMAATAASSSRYRYSTVQ